MIPTAIMRRLRMKKTETKMDAYRFESGKESMTQQVLHMNLRAVLVGKNGKVYDKEEWIRSGTFWQDDQYNLIIADNQTNAYAKGDLEEKWRLFEYAWADVANPLGSAQDYDPSTTGMPVKPAIVNHKSNTRVP